MKVSKTVAKNLLKVFYESKSTMNEEDSMQKAIETLDKEFGRGICEPVCMNCSCEMRLEKSGVGLLLMASFGPYRLYDADLHKCPSCGGEIIAGLGSNPISEHFKEDFGRLIEAYRKNSLLIEVR